MDGETIFDGSAAAGNHRGLVAEFAARGLKVDYRSVWNFVHAEALSFKKNRARQRARSSRRGTKAGTVEGLSEPG
jgi:transposase